MPEKKMKKIEENPLQEVPIQKGGKKEEWNSNLEKKPGAEEKPDGFEKHRTTRHHVSSR